MRRAVAVAAATALVITAAGCAAGGSSSGGEAGGDETVTFWQFDTSQATIDAYNDAIEGFEKENPSIKVKMEIVPWASQQQKITTAIASGSLPDVSMMGNNVVAQYAAAGQLAPLDSYVEQWSKDQGGDIKSDFLDGDLSYYTYDGKLYGSPVAAETRMVYFNKNLFTKAGLDPASPPDSWQEMQAAATKLKQKTDSTPWAAPMSNQYITMQTFMSVYLSYGARLFDEGRCGLDSDAGKQALTYYTGIAKAGLTAADAANLSDSDLDSMFTAGKAGMLIEGPALWEKIKAENPDLAKDVGVAPIPAGPEGRFGFLGGWPLVMWKSSERPDAAAKWIEYATSPDGALKGIATTSGILPARKSLSTQEPWDAAPYDGFAKQLAENSYPYQYPDEPNPKMGQIETSTVQTAVQQVATGSQSVDEALSQMCGNMNRILDQ